MPEQLNITISGDATKFITALKSAGVEVKTLETEAKNTTDSNKELKEIMSGLGIQTLTTAGAIAGLVAGIKSSIDAAREANLVDAQLATVLQSTHGAAGMTKSQLDELATSLQAVSNYDDDAVKSSEALLLTFTSIGKEVFPRAQKAILDTSVALGQDLKSSTIQIGKALNDPIEGLSALRRVGVSFTDQQKEMIETMVKAGDVAGAQGVILAELEKEFGGSAEAARLADGGFAALSNSIGNLKEAIGGELMPAATNLNEFLIQSVDSWTRVISQVDLLVKATDKLQQQQKTGTDGIVEQTVAWTQWLGEINPINAAIAKGGDVLKAYIFNQDELATAVQDVVAASQDEAGAVADAGQAHQQTAEEIQAQQEATEKLLLSEADYFNSVGEMQDKQQEKMADYLDKINDLQKNANDSITENEQAKEEKLKDLRDKAEEERQRAIEQGGSRDASYLDNRLAAIQKNYEEEKAKTIKHYDDENADIRAKQDERLKDMQDAQKKQEEEYQKHLDDLKLKTVLGMLEATGQLEQLTGGVTAKANDAFDLIKAGIIPVTGQLADAMHDQYGKLSQASNDYKNTATANQTALQSVFSSTFQRIQTDSGQMANKLISDVNSISEAARRAQEAFNSLISQGVGAGQAASGARYTGLAAAYGMAGGGSFVVPGSGSGDRPYTLNLEPGEQVTVTPKNQTVYNYNANYYGAAQPPTDGFEAMRAWSR